MTGSRSPERQALSEIDLERCSQEEIHLPNAIQPHGALLAARSQDLLVTHASANLASIMGTAAEQALGRPLQDILGEAACQALVRASGRGGHGSFQADCRTTLAGTSRHLRAHRSGALLCVEIEPGSEDSDVMPFIMMQSVLESFSEAITRVDLCQRAVRALKDFTGYDRVMAYRFGPTGDGEVIAEACEPGLTPYLNHHYPASDIPAQARRQYVRQRLGMITDSAYQPVPLLVHPTLHDGTPFDLTYCGLRSVSPVHRAYMRNMGTAASLTVGLAIRQQLWGMLVCHHQTPRIASVELRAAANKIGLVVSLLLANLHEIETLAIQSQRAAILNRLLDKLASQDSMPAAFTAAGDELLALVKADGALIRCGGALTRLGQVPAEPAASNALSLLHGEAAGKALALDDLIRVAPECLPEAAGALLQPLSVMTDDAVLWFRRELAETVTWGGDPRHHAIADPVSGAISPRQSFAAWKEIVRSRSEPWHPADLALADDVRFAIEAELAKRARTRLQQDLARSNADLEDFAYAASHDLKAPLRAIAHLAQWIDEDIAATASPTTMKNLGLLQGRVSRLQRLLNGLLEYSRIGTAVEAAVEAVDIVAVVRECAEMLAPPPGFVVTCVEPILPIRTHPVPIQVILENLIGNGIKHHDRSAGTITVSVVRKPDGIAEIRVSDDGPGIAPRYHDRIFTLFQTLVSRDVNEASGVGLAIVKKRVLANGGRIWVESAPPERGTTIGFTWKEAPL